MADQDKIKSGLLKDILKEMKGTNERFEKIAQAEMAAASEGKNFISGGFAAARAREKIAQEWVQATKGTIDRRSAFFEGMGLTNVSKLMGAFSKQPPSKTKELEKKFGLGKKESSGGATSLRKPISLILRNVIETSKVVKNIEKSLSKPSLKSGYTFDPRMAGGGRYRNLATNKLVSAKEATQAAQIMRTDRLTKMIAADEDPMIRVADSLDAILKTLGNPERRTVHQKLDQLLDDSGGFDLGFPRRGLGGSRGGTRGNRRTSPISKKVNERYKRRFGRNAPGYGSRGGMRGGGIGIGGLLGAAAGGYLAYNAVDSLRDETLQSYDPELLKEEARMLAGTDDIEAKQALQDQIVAQKQDVKIQAAATAAGGVGAVGGALAVKKVAQSKVVRNVKSKVWTLFLKFVEKRAPSLFAKVGARLAAAGGMALVPFVGWVSAAITVVGSVWMAYDLYTLWREFSALSDAEKELAAGEVPPTPSAPPVTPLAKGPSTRGGRRNEPTGTTVATPTPSMSGAGTVSAATMTAAAAPVAFTKGPEQRYATGKPTKQKGLLMPPKDVKDAISNASKAVGVNEGVMLAMAKQESGFNPSAKASTSSAAGLYQFIKGTWNSMVQQYGSKFPDLFKGPYDTNASAIAGALYIKENSKILEKNGIPINGTTIYASHFLGPGGAVKLFNADPNSLADRIFGAAAKANKFIFYTKEGVARTVSQVQEVLYNKVGKYAEMYQSVAGGGGPLGGVAASTGPVATAAASTPKSAPSPAPTPTPRTTGAQVATQSAQLEKSKLTAQTPQPAPVVINNNTSGNKTPPQAPKQQLSMASTRSSENAFNRAISKDFAHPTAFTSVGLV